MTSAYIHFQLQQLEHQDHHIHQLPLENTPMSLLNFAKSALTRPSKLSALVAVGVALVLALHGCWTYSDFLQHQPITARKMHIQSIPMCEFDCFVYW
jgi:hypothetical protein